MEIKSIAQEELMRADSTEDRDLTKSEGTWEGEVFSSKAHMKTPF